MFKKIIPYEEKGPGRTLLIDSEAPKKGLERSRKHLNEKEFNEFKNACLLAMESVEYKTLEKDVR